MTTQNGRIRSFALTMAQTVGLCLLFASHALAKILYGNPHPVAWIFVFLGGWGVFSGILVPLVLLRRELLEEMARKEAEQKPFEICSELIAMITAASLLGIGVNTLLEVADLWAYQKYPVEAKMLLIFVRVLFCVVSIFNLGDKFLCWRIAVRQAKGANWWKAR